MPIHSDSHPRVVIAGGGLAGLACAKQLVDAGYPVTVLERAEVLGGRASTWLDEDGDWIEQGLHLFHGGYSQFRKLLRQIGQGPQKVLFFTDTIRFEEPNGPSATFGINPLWAPLQTLRSVFGNNRYLGPLAKLSLLPLFAPAILPMSVLKRGFDDRTVEHWWAQVCRSTQALERVIRPFCRAIQFSDVDEFSAYNLLGWGHHTIIRPLRARLGGYRGARDEIIFQPFEDYLVQRGAEIRKGVEIAEIMHDAATRKVTGLRLAGGELVEADVYVVALPQWIFVDLMPEAWKPEPFFASILALPVAPAIAVQMWFDRDVSKFDGFVMVPNSVTPTWQDQARRTYPYAGGSRISVIVAPADELLEWDDAAIADHVKTVLGQANPRIAEAVAVKTVVLKHPRHLIRPLPGAMTKLPRQATPIANLFLAGDWTQQSFFGSQEGAVRGGNRCAKAIRRVFGR